jgi:N-acylneuraminate cytidylyltransferase
LAHSIEAALGASTVTRVVVSTDDDEIAETAARNGAEVVRRPSELAADTASSESALLHVLDHLQKEEGYEPDLVVFLQATSPIRDEGDIDGAVGELKTRGADSLLSVVSSHRFLWRLNEGVPQPLNYDPQARPRRQDREPEFAENGSIYVFKPWVLREFNCRLGGKVALYEMGPWSGIDIDTPADLELCEWVMSHVSNEDEADSEPPGGADT